MTGLANTAAASRSTWMASASSSCRWGVETGKWAALSRSGSGVDSPARSLLGGGGGGSGGGGPVGRPFEQADVEAEAAQQCHRLAARALVDATVRSSAAHLDV